MNDTVKWVVVGLAVPLCLFLLGALTTMQGYVDARQDESIVQASVSMTDMHQEQQRLIEKLSDNARKTAEALQKTVTTLQELDNRGSNALREHEKTRGEEAH